MFCLVKIFIKEAYKVSTYHCFYFKALIWSFRLQPPETHFHFLKKLKTIFSNSHVAQLQLSVIEKLLHKLGHIDTQNYKQLISNHTAIIFKKDNKIYKFKNWARHILHFPTYTCPLGIHQWISVTKTDIQPYTLSSPEGYPR